MKTKDFLKKHEACCDGARWALSIGKEMVDVWDAMIEQGKHAWLIWTATRPGVFSASILRKLACRFVRDTPLHDGCKVWDLLTDECSRRAVDVAELYADGKATYEELEAAYSAAADAAYDAAADAAYDAAADAAYDAAADAADDAAYAAAYNAAAATRAAARAAYTAAYNAAAATRAAARAAYAVTDVAYATTDAAAKAAQVKMIAELGNPFGKGQEDERH